MFNATNTVPDKVFTQTKDLVLRLKRKSTRWVNTLAAGGSSDFVFSIIDSLYEDRESMKSIRGTSGLIAYAQEQELLADYDIVAELDALIILITDVISSVVLAFPTNSGGFLLAHTINAEGQRIPREFSSANLAEIKNKIQLIADNIT